MHRLGRALLVLGLVGMVAGCAATPSASAPASPAGSSTVADAEICPPLALRLPTGAPLNLTGTWLANDFGSYYLSQRQSCVHWLGLSNSPGDLPGTWWGQVFVGRLSSDFTMTGEWGDVPYRNDSVNAGELTLGVDTYQQDGETWPAFHLLEQRGGYAVGGHDWVLEESLPDKVELTGAYGYDENCPWLDIDGDRYELVMFEYYASPSGHLIGPDNEIVARPGDQLHVTAQVTPQLAWNDCQSSALMVWALEPVS